MAGSLSSTGESRRSPFSNRKEEGIVIGLVFASFLLFSAVRSPVPGINEPHYLVKAKHYWDPGWIENDFFLNSSSVHAVFYSTVGLLTKWFSLEQTAWLGRGLGLLVMAAGWTRMVSRIVPGRWSCLWGAWMFLLFEGVGGATRRPLPGNIEFYAFNLSGEWIIGGIEGKVFAYGLLFGAIGLLIDGRIHAAAVCLGLSIAFHPVVGVWGLICLLAAGGVLFWEWWAANRDEASVLRGLKKVPVAAALLVACALPGLVPAVLLLRGAEAEPAAQADFIQVFGRLAHHLDPMTFRIGDYVSYVFLILFWLAARGRMRSGGRGERLFAWFVAATIVAAAAGILIGFRTGNPEEMLLAEWRTKLLKFYPFRLCDVFVPLAVSLASVAMIHDWSVKAWPGEAFVKRRGGGWVCWLIFALPAAAALWLPAPDRNPSRMDVWRQASWRDICGWIAGNTPEEAVFMTPRESWAFKWYAHRAEFVSFKDCPQDAAGILEWQRRREFALNWEQQQRPSGFTRDELRRLHNATGITHLLVRRFEPYQISPLYWNNSFKVYAIEDLRGAEP